MPSCIVIGAGPVGLATAFGLKKQGFDVTVYDRVDLGAAIQKAQKEGTLVDIQFGETQGGAISLFLNGIDALKGLGLADTVLESPHCEVTEFIMRKMDGSDPVASYVTKGHTGRQFLRPDIHLPIMKACTKAGIRVFIGSRIAHIEQTADAVTASFEDGTSATADFLVGADGTHSVTRRLVFPEAAPPKFWCIGYIMVHERKATTDDGMPIEIGNNMTLFNDQLTGNMVFCGNCSDRYGSIFVFERRSFDVSENSGATEAWRPYTDLPKESKRLAQVVEEWGVPRRIVECVKNSSRITPVSIYDVPDLATFSKGRVLLVGDAAHGTVPTIGQGLCSGLEDAATLSDLFGVFKPEEYQTVFKLFDEIRLPRVHKVYANARDVSTRMKSSSPFRAKFDRFMMKTVFSILLFFGVTDELVHYKYSEDVQRVIAKYKSQ